MDQKSKRIELHEILLGFSKNVYYQPPENLKLKYPCIVYEKNDVKADYADNKLYSSKNQYSITYIDTDPDSNIPDKIMELPYSSYDRNYISDNLHHDVIRLFY